MRKKHCIITVLIILFFSANFQTAAQTNLSLDAAIQNTSRDIETRLPQGARLVLVNFVSPSPAMTDYIIEEFTVCLMDSGNITVIDHNTLNRALVSAEIDLQLSGNVSDETIVSVGRLMGSQYALSGSLGGSGNSLRFEVFLTEIKTQRRQSLGPLNIQRNERLTALMNQKARPEPRISERPLTSGEFFQRGQEYINRGEYAKAVADFTEALKFAHVSETEVMLYQRGYAYEKLGKYNEAIADLSRVIERNGELGAAFYARSSCYSSIKEFDKALADASRVIQLTPNLASSYILRSHVYLEKRDFDKAIADAHYVVNLQPKHANSHQVLFLTYGAKGELEKAEESYRTALSLGLDTKAAQECKDILCGLYIERGIASGSRRNHSAAILDFSRAIGLDPTKAAAFANRGMGYFNMGEFDKAITDLEQAAKLLPNNAQIKSTLDNVRRMRDMEAAWED